MTAVTVTNLKALILAEVGDTTSGPVGVQIDVLWELFASRALVAPYLQYLYTLRKAIDIMAGARRASGGMVDVKSGSQEIRHSQEWALLSGMRDEVTAEIVQVEASARANRTIRVGQLTTVAPILPNSPIQPDLTRLDAGSRIYRGDPYIRSFRRGGSW